MNASSHNLWYRNGPYQWAMAVRVGRILVCGVWTGVWTWSKRRKSESGKSSRFLPRHRFGTDRGWAVHTLLDMCSVCGAHVYGQQHTPNPLSNRQRAEEQHVPKCSGVRRR